MLNVTIIVIDLLDATYQMLKDKIDKSSQQRMQTLSRVKTSQVCFHVLCNPQSLPYFCHFNEQYPGYSTAVDLDMELFLKYFRMLAGSPYATSPLDYINHKCLGMSTGADTPGMRWSLSLFQPRRMHMKWPITGLRKN